MAAAIMLVCFPLLFVATLARRHEAPLSTAWRTAFLAASLLWSVYLAAATEILSVFHLLTPLWVFLLWTALAVMLEAHIAWQVRRGQRLWKRFAFRPLPRSLWALLGGTAAVAAVALLVAVAAPPNTPDDMTYHLARVMHWIQNATLTPYPTNVIRQDIQPPWAEYVFLHLHLLTGGDWLDGTVQWFSFAGCIIGVSLVSKRLGAGAHGQVFAAVCAATIHMAIIQAASTQNDLVLAYWLVCVAYYLLQYVTSPARGAALGAGASLGLATLTKAPAYVYAVPFVLVFGICILRSRHRHAWRPLIVVALFALVLNFGFFFRNVTWFGNPLGPVATARSFSNANYTPDVLALNVVRNVAVEFGTPWQQVNLALNTTIYHALEFVRLNPNDPRATMSGSPSFLLRGESGLWVSDGYTTNPLDVLLVFLTAICCVSSSTLRRQRLLMSYLAALVGAFLLFNLYLRWQAGNNRLLLGLFVLAAPFVGTVMEKLCDSGRRVAWVRVSHIVLAVNALLLLTLIPWMLFSQSRPLVGASSVLTTPRLAQYFAVSPPAERAYVIAAHDIAARGCTQVGFYASGPQDRAGYDVGAPAWEYPLWVLLDGSGGGAVRIEQVNVTNATAPLTNTSPFAGFRPCAIFAIMQPSALRDELVSGGRVYHRIMKVTAFYQGIVAEYVPETPAQTPSNRVQ